MAKPSTKLQRWLDLVSYLVGRRVPVALDELMEAVPAYAARWRSDDATARATVRRTFERDKDELRALGVPLEAVRYRINYGAEEIDAYQLARRDFYLPYLRLVQRATGATPPAPAAAPRPYPLAVVALEPGEARAAADALRLVRDLPAFPFERQARSALRKLAFDLVPGALDADDAAGPLPPAPVLHLDRPGAAALPERLAPLADALLARKAVRFRYHGIHRDAATAREVHPWGLFFQHGNWYLVAHDPSRGDRRVFRVDRMAEVEANTAAPHTPDYEIPAGFRLRDHLHREAWELGDDDEAPLVARVLFRFPASLAADRNGHGALVEERAGGAALREFRVRQVNPFLRWVLSHAGEAEVTAPPELVAEQAALARAVAAAHGGEVA
jgi:proteasome accessory factor B